MKVLITGIDGFVGSHLTEYILKNHKDYLVFGTHRIKSDIEYNNLTDEVLKQIQIEDCDLTDRASVFRVINKIKPDKIFHLAAQSFVRSSWDNPEYTLANNIFGQLNIFEVILEMKKENDYNPIIQIACSSEEYGNMPKEDMPINEMHELNPASPYAVSKVTQELLAKQYHESYGLKTIITRAFNHEGPRRGTQFVTASFAKQIADINNGKKEPIMYVGNLEASRDFTDVRDMVRAYWLATEKCDYGEPYNICSGKTVKISYVLDYLLSLSKVKIEVRQDPNRMRPSDLEVLLGDCTKFYEKTGWIPEIYFEQTLKDLYNYHYEIS